MMTMLPYRTAVAVAVVVPIPMKPGLLVSSHHHHRVRVPYHNTARRPLLPLLLPVGAGVVAW